MMSAPRRRSRLFTTSAFGALALAALWAAPAQAQLVQGATPAQSNGAGPAIDQSVPNTTTVTLGGSRTVIDWDKFDINSGDTANFVFANRSDIVLNRVGGAASTINGNLNGKIGSAGGATGGNIWIYNANGVVMGANARITTGGLLVTTAALDRATDSSAGGFLDGSSTSFGFTGSATDAGITVQNGAQIASHGGAIALVSTTVTAEAGSSISAQDGGNVLIGSAAKYKISFRPTGTDDMDLLSFEVANAADGTNSNNGTSLAGAISGNRVFVATIAKTGLTNQIINTGTITATDAALDETGAIVLSTGHNIVNGAASSATFVTDAGYGDLVSGTGASGSLTAPEISLLASNTLYANGAINAGAGTVDMVSHYAGISSGFGANNGITAGTLTADANYGITLQSTNHIAKIGGLTVHDTGNLFADDIYVQNQDNLEIAGDIRTAAGVTLYSPTGTFSGTGSVYADKVSVMGRGVVNVDSATRLAYADSYGDLEIRSNGDLSVGLDGSSSQNNITRLTASNGAITQTGAAGLGGTVIANAAGEINLSGANSFTSLTANSTDGERVTVNATGNLDFKVNTFSTARFTVGGDATSSGTNALFGDLLVTAGGAINLSSDGGDAAFGDLSAGGNITLAMDGVLRLGGVIQANGGTASFTSRNGAIQQLSGSITADAISFDADSTITQSNGAFVQTGGLSLTSGSTATLGSANSFTSLQGLHVGGDLTLRNAGTINLDPVLSGGYTAGGALNLTSDTGSITAGNDINTVKLTASAANGSILLGGAGNLINSLGTLTAGGDIEIGTSTAGFTLTGDITATNLTLLVPNGGITQNDFTKITAGTLTANANNIITLDQANAVTTVLGLNANLFTAGHGITFRNNGDITLGGVVDATGGTLRLTSNTGGISQNSGASIYVRADQLFLSGTSDVLLNNASNNVATLGGISSTNGGILYRDANGFDIAGNITATSGGASLRTAGAGSITQSGGIIDVDYLGVITAGSGNTVTLNQANRIHRLIATSGNGTLSINSTTGLLIDQSIYFDTISLSSGGAITQSNTGSFGAGTVNLSAVTGINLPGASFVGNNSILNFGTITNTTSGGINIVSYSGSHISLTGNISAAGQTVSITDVAGYILQTGGVITADTLNMSATGGINVQGANQISNLGAMTGPGVTFANAGSFNVTQSIGVSAGIYLTSNSGAITQNAGTTLTADTIGLTAGTTISQGAGATLHTTNLSLTSGGTTTLGEANDFTTLTDLAVGGDLTLRNLGNINLSPILGGTGGYRSGGALTLVSDTGNILTTNSGIDTSRLNVSAAGSISLDGTIASLGTITAGQSILLSTYNGSMELTGNVTGQNISLYGNAGLSQSGGIIDAGRLNVITNGDISLTGANQIDVVGRLDTDQFDSGTGHDITLHNVGAIVLDYQIEAPDGTVTLTSDTGGISQTSFSNLFVARALNASAAGDILLDYAGNNVGRVTGLRTSSGNISFNEANGFDIFGDITTPGNVSLTSGGAIETYTGHLSADTLSVLAGDEVSLNVIGNIKLGAVDTSGAGVTSGGNFFLTTDGDIELTGAVTTGNRNLLLNTTGGAITTNGGTVSANYNGSTGVIYATADGGIDLTSVGSAVIWATSVSGGNINLAGDVDIGFMVNTTGDLTVTAGGWAGNNSDVIARSVGISAGTGISLNDQTVNIDVGSYRNLTVADGFIDIENKGDIKLDGDVTTGVSDPNNYIRLNSSQNSILQNSGTISGYSVELDAAQSVTQDINAKVVTGDYGLTLRGTDVSLIGANEFPWINTYTVSHDLTLRVVGNLDMSGSANQAGTNHYTTLISDTGNIIGGPIFSAKLSATATNGSLSFTYGNNRIGSLGDLTAKSTSGTDIEIFTDSLLGLTGNITGGGVILHATQGINQTAGVITADRLAAGTSGNLLLGGANNFGTLTEAGHGNGTNVTIRNLGSIVLPTTSNSFGTLTLTSDTGSISQTAAITVATLIANAATGITLNTAGNNFATLAGLTTAAGDIRIADTGGFAIEGNVTAPGTVAFASTGNITTGTTTVGSVTTPHGKVDADTLTVSATNATVYVANDIKLGASSVSSGFTLVADGSIDLTATSNFNGASLIATAGSITQSGGILTGNTVLTAAGGSITLDKNNNLTDFGGTSYGGGNVTFNNVSASALSLSLNTTGNAVVTTAGDVLGSFINLGDLSLTAGAIDLRTNVAVSSFSKLVASYGDVLVTNTGGFSITGDVTASTAGIRSVNLQANGGGISQAAGTISANDVALRGSGDLTQSGTGRVVTNVISLTGANVLFGGANDFGSGHVSAGGSLTLRNAGSIDLDALGGYSNGGGVLTLTSDNGSITAHNAVVTTVLSALAANGNVAFDNASNAILRIDDLRALGTGTVYTNSPLFLDGNLEAGAVLALRSQGGIIRLGGALKAASLSVINGGSGSIALNGNNDVDTLVALTAAGDVSFRDTDGFQIDGNVGGDHVSLVTDAGSIYEKNGSTLTANHLTASAVDGLQLNQVGNSIQYIDGLTLGGASGASLGIASSGGDMHLAGNVNAAGQYVTFYVAGGSLVQDSGTISAGNLGITVPDGSATLGANAISNLGSINVRDDFIANSDLSTGVLGLAGNIVVGGTTTITNSAGIAQGPAGSINTYNLNLITAGSLDMGNVINMVGGQANIEMGDGAFLSYLDLNLRLNATGAAAITSYGNITFTGAGSSSAGTLTLSAANGIYSGAGAGGQIAVEHLGVVTNSGSGGIALNLLGNVTLEGDVTAVGQTVSIGVEDGLSQATGTVITANRLNVLTTGAGASVLLDNANAISTFGLGVLGDATVRSTLATMIAPNVMVGGALTVHSDGDITMGGGTVLGTLALYSGGAVNSSGYVSANRVTGSAVGDFYLDVSSLNYLGAVTSGDDIEIGGSSSAVTIDGDITAAGGIEISGNALSQTAGTITTGTGRGIGLSASGAIGQSGTGRILAGTVSASGGSIDLTGANQITGTGSSFTSSGGAIGFRNQGNVDTSGVVFSGGRNALTLISDTGSVTQSGAVDATSVKLRAATGINFSNANNTIDAIAEATNSISGGIVFATTNLLGLTGNVTAAGQSVSLSSTSGIGQLGGAITAGSLTVSASDGIALTSATNNVATIAGLTNTGTGGIAYTDADGFSIAGDIAASGQTLSLRMAGTGAYATQGSASHITAGLLNLTGGDVFDLRGNGGGNNHIAALGDISSAVQLYTTGNVDLTGTIVSPYFELWVSGGDVTQSGGHIDNSASGNFLEVRANNITLTSGTNQFARGASLLSWALTPGSVTAVSSGNTVFDYISGGAVSLTVTGGNLSGSTGSALDVDSLTASASGTISLGGRIGRLDDITAGGDASFTSTSTLAVNGTINIGTGRLTLGSSGTLFQTGGSITAGGLDASGATGLVLNGNANDVGTVYGLSSQSGGIFYFSVAGIALAGDVNAGTGADVDLRANNGSITQTAGIITARQLAATATDQIELTQVNRVARLGDMSAANAINFTARDDYALGAILSASSVTLTSTDGAINQTGGAINTASLSAYASTGLDLFQANYVNALGPLSTTTGDLRLRNHGGIALSNLSVGGNVALLSDIGAISQGVGTTLAATGTVTLTAQNGVVLGNANSIGTLGQVSNLGTGGIAIANAGDLILTGNLTTPGQQLSLSSNNGAILQQGGIFVASNVIAHALGAITLDQSNNVNSSTASTFSSTNGNIVFHSANAILLGAVSTPGQLSLTADTGGIAQTIAISAGALSAASLDGDIMLDQANAIGRLNDVTTDGSFTFAASGNLTLDGDISAPTLVKLTAAGNLTQIGTGAIHSDRLVATSGVGATNGISLLNHNDVDQATLNSNGKDLRFRNTGDFALGNISAAGHIVEMISDTGSVTQLAGTSILAGTFSATGTNVVLDNTGNQISRIGLISTGSDLSLRNDVALQIDAIDAAGHTVTINNGDNLTGGNITADKLIVNLIGGYVDLSTANHVATLGGFNGYEFRFTNDESFTISGAIQNGMYQSFLTSQNGSISMAGGVVNSAAITAQAATGISLTGSMSYVYGATTTTGDVTLNSWLLDIQGDISGDTVTLGGTANGGFVRQTSGSITANLLNGSSYGNFDLDGATNHIAALGTLSSTFGHINIASLDAVDLTGNIDNGDTFTLNAGGAVDQTGGRIKSTWLNVTGAGDITLDAANLIDSGGSIRLFGDNVTFVNDGTFTIDQINAGIHAIDLTSTNGNIWQSSVMVGGSITASAHGSLSLNQGNAIDTIGKLSAGTELTYNSSTAYALTDDITVGTTVTLNGASGITQTGGTISGQSLIVTAGSADLRQANTVGQLGGATTSGDFLFRNVGDIELWGSSNSVVGGKLGLYSDTGSVTNPGALFTANIVDVTAAGGINLNGGSFNYIDRLTTQNGDITVITTSNILGGNLISAPGTVDLTVGRITADSVKANQLNVDATGNDIELTGDNEIARLGYLFGDNISLAVGQTAITGYINASNSIAFIRSGLATTFALATAGGALRAPMISISNTGSAGTATLSNITTPSSALELNFNFNGNASVTASSSAIYLNNAVIDGDLSLHANGAISNSGAHSAISGTISAQNNTGDIGLNFGSDTVGHFGDILAGGYVGLGAASVDLTGTVQSGAGVGVFAANGSITQTSGSSITANTIQGIATGDLLLGGNNTIGTINGLSAGGDLTFKTSGALQIGGTTSTGALSTMTLVAGGDINVTSSVSISGGTLSVFTPGQANFYNTPLTPRAISFATLGDVSADSFELYNAGGIDLTGNIAVTNGMVLNATGQITQSAGSLTADLLTLYGNGVEANQQNHVHTLQGSAAPGAAFSFTNAQDLVLNSNPGTGDVTLTVNGDLTANGGIGTSGDLTLNVNGIQTGELRGNSVTVNGGAHDLNIGDIVTSDDVSVTGTGRVTVGALRLDNGNDVAGDGFNALISGGDVILGAPGASIALANFVDYSLGGTPGSVTIQATGNATVGVDNIYNATVNISAAGNAYAESSHELLLGTVSGANVTLLAGTSLSATSVTVPGTYSVTAGDIGSGAFNILGGNPLDIIVTDTAGDLTLTGNLVARRNTTITAQAGNVLGSTAHLGAGTTMDGTLTVNGANIALAEASSLYDVVLDGIGTVDVGLVYAGRDYTLKGNSFLGGALAPIGTRTGTWTLTSLSALDLGATTLEYNGGIDFNVSGLLSNGTIHAIDGAVTGTASSIDLYELLAGTNIDATASAGALTVFHAAADTDSATLRSNQALTVTGSVEAGTDVALSAQFGAASAGYASAGRAISVYSLFSNATLRQATLTGTTGDVTVQSILGTATLGADDSTSIASDNYFERAAGSTGSAYVLGSAGAQVNLDHSADMALVQANSAAVHVSNGVLTIGLLQAYTGTASAYLGNGSLTVNAASGSTVDLAAWGGDLTLGGAGISANDLYLNSDGTIDTSAIASLSANHYLYIEGGSVRASGLSSGGNVEVYGDTGGVTADMIGSAGDLWVGANGNLAIDHVSVTGSADLETNGTATIRDLTASNGFTLLAQGNITLGANAGDIATTSNTIITNGALGGCGCGGGWIASAGGDISINLFAVTGVLDRVSADTGDVSISLGSGNLGINTLRGHNIAVSIPGQLTVTDAESSGGSYALTAADFGGLALSPTLFGGATRLGDVTIIDTDGDLNSTGSLLSSGDIHVEAQDGAITGGLVLNAAGDVTATGQGVRLQQVTGRDVTIDAGTGAAAISNSLSVDRNYTLTAGDFSGNVLAINGAKAGSLAITDTVGDFDFGSTDLAFGGAISIDASQGRLNVGNLQAGSAITLNAGGNLSLASAKLTDTGTSALSLTAGGDLQFGAADAASITSSNVFSHASPVLTGTSIHAGGNLAINLYQADGLGAIDGGTVQITTVTGDFSAGSIDAVGALSVQGPSGTLTLGNLTTSAGHINISGQGNTTLGNVFGHFIINLGASAGNLSVGTVAGDDVSFLVAGGINAASVSASTLGVVAVNGDVDLDHGGAGSNIVSLGTVTVNNGGFKLRNLYDLGLDGTVEVNGTLDLDVDGALTQNAWTITADRLQGSVTGAATLGGDNRINALGGFSSNGLKLNNASALAIDGAVDAGSGGAAIASHGGMTITANGSVTTTATGNALTLASDGLFTNLAGAGALSTPNGRWLVYTQTGGNPGQSDPNNDFGGLAGISYYGDTYDFVSGSFASAPNAGNRFVYGYRPVLTVMPSSLHLVYDGTVPNVTTTITGLVHGDSAANAYSGAADISGVGSNAGTYFAYSALGSLASEMGYTFAFVPGTVIIDPRVITAVLNASDRTYDGTTNASGTLVLDGVISGDTVTANAGSMSFDSRNAGTRTVTAGGITLSGASASNYSVNVIATDLADILARAITATLTANDRTYDGTTNATGSLALNGVLGNDDVSVNGATLAFDSKNAGTRTVTASGITLTGGDAGNYIVTTTATDLADILARAITATLSANGRTYDGTTNATGTLSLGGVLGNDQVTANGNLTFDSRNAGTGRTVTASGISLSGADAGNYTVNASTTGLADILARAITATLTANDRTYDGTIAATGTLGLSGVVSGDTVSAGAGSMVFNNGNAGTGRTVTASGISLSGADAGNYTVNVSATGLADILARAITATLTANGRVYDGTTLATGSLALNGVLSGDQVTVSAGGIAFDSKNAGTRTATASGLTLGGTSAANYTVTGTATGTAVIDPRAITAAATADSHVYDGTTATTGRIALSGVISGDTVTGTASYRFADANAGTGRTVQVSGLGLSGADAGNYTVSLSATPVTADITRRSVTVTVNDVTKILGQPDPAFGYTVSSGNVVNGDSFTGAPIRAAGDQVGRYAIGQGTLALSANYLLTVVPGTLVISLTQSGAEASDALKMLQDGVGIRFSVNQDPSRNLEGDGEQGPDGDGAK